MQTVCHADGEQQGETLILTSMTGAILLRPPRGDCIFIVRVFIVTERVLIAPVAASLKVARRRFEGRYKQLLAAESFPAARSTAPDYAGLSPLLAEV
jgi:hypothetical protein